MLVLDSGKSRDPCVRRHMLKNTPRLLVPGALHALAAMGHGNAQTRKYGSIILRQAVIASES